MALEHKEGCSHLGSGSTIPPAISITRKWTSALPLGCYYVTTPVRRTNPSYAAPALAIYLNSSFLQKTLTYQGSRYMAAAYYMDSSDSEEDVVFQMLSGGQSLANIKIEADLTVSIYANGTLAFNSGTYVFTTNAYHYIEWYVELTGGSPISIYSTLKIDGQVLVTGATGNTNVYTNQLLSNALTMNQVGIAGGRAYTMDVLVMNSSATDVNGFATTLNGFQGDVQIMDIVPDADVVTNWTLVGGATRFGVLANIPPQDDVEYISSDTINQVNSINMTPISLSLSGTLLSVQLCVYAKKDAEGSRAIRAQLNGTDIANWTTVGLTPIFDQYLYDYYDFFLFPLDSLLGTAWTPTNFNSAVFGVKVSI